MSNARKTRRDLARIVERLTQNYTISNTRGGHIRITLQGELGERSVIVAGSPSDHRMLKNFRADLARAFLAVTPKAPPIKEIEDGLSD